jgi:prephenate dehydrogenase
VFDTIAIIGVGLLGGSFGMDVRARGLARRVVGITRSARTAREIVAHGAADEAATTMDAIRDADLVVLAAPVQAIIAGMPDVARHAAPGALVTDMGSTKAEIVRAGEAALGRRFVGGHPMAGSHTSGVSAARRDLFVGATWVVTPTENTDPAAADRLAHIATALGARAVRLDVVTHDRIAAAVSHMPHVVACALAQSIGQLANGDHRFGQLAAGGLRDMTRLAASPAALWTDILSTNRSNTKAALRAFRDALDEAIAGMDSDADIHALFEESAGTRAWLMDEGKGSATRAPDAEV